MEEKWHFVVSLPAMKKYGRRQVEDYIRDAVRNWSGQFHPEDEMFEHSRKAAVQPLANVMNARGRGGRFE